MTNNKLNSTWVKTYLYLNYGNWTVLDLEKQQQKFRKLVHRDKSICPSSPPTTDPSSMLTPSSFRSLPTLVTGTFSRLWVTTKPFLLTPLPVIGETKTIPFCKRTRHLVEVGSEQTRKSIYYEIVTLILMRLRAEKSWEQVNL